MSSNINTTDSNELGSCLNTIKKRSFSIDIGPGYPKHVKCCSTRAQNKINSNPKTNPNAMRLYMGSTRCDVASEC